MMKVFTIAFFIFCLKNTLIESIHLKCSFYVGIWAFPGLHYFCYTTHQDDIAITDRSNRDIHAIIGNHQDLRTNDDVNVFQIFSNVVFYFPRGLEKFFVNLEGIYIYQSKLKEIRGEDLQEFNNLKYIYLASNEIQFLEPNLFKFNPKIEFISLANNKIAHIDAKIFDNFVDRLSNLYLSANVCQFENAKNSKQNANQLIGKIQTGFCTDLSLLPAVTSVTFEDLRKLIDGLRKDFNEKMVKIKEGVTNVTVLSQSCGTCAAEF